MNYDKGVRTNMIDQKKIEECIKDIIIALGENPNRQGLVDTPRRVAKMYEEIFCGINYSNDDIAEMFNVTFDECVFDESNEMVIIKDIEAFSFCEHHMALIYNMKICVAYVPKNKIIGLSKIIRICDMICKRLQVQERIGKDISYILKKIVETDDIAVVVKAEHSCISVRGIKKNNSVTTTITLNGCFKTDSDMYNKLMRIQL
jgi:GTP cyclohydrolase I